MAQIDLNKYAEFVKIMASVASSDFDVFTKRTQELHGVNFDVPRVLNGVIGMSSESGELLEMIKKIVFQGKELTDENRESMIKELGDVMWYITQTCLGFGVTLEEVLKKNVSKLNERYPDSAFDVWYSENRTEENN